MFNSLSSRPVPDWEMVLPHHDAGDNLKVAIALMTVDDMRDALDFLAVCLPEAMTSVVADLMSYGRAAPDGRTFADRWASAEARSWNI